SGEIAQLGVGERLDGAGDRTVVNERRLISAPALDVPIERVLAHVEARAREPAIKRRPRGVEDAVPRSIPRDCLRRLAPEAFRIAQRARVGFVVTAHRFTTAKTIRLTATKSSNQNTG